MTVYRVENADGVGPYKSDWTWRRRMNQHHSIDFDGHPTPQNEGLKVPANGICGFTSLSALTGWFDGYIVVLLHAGYRIVAVEVPDSAVERGKRQCVFNSYYRIGNRRLLIQY